MKATSLTKNTNRLYYIRTEMNTLIEEIHTQTCGFKIEKEKQELILQ